LSDRGTLSCGSGGAPISNALLRNRGDQLRTAEWSTDRRHAATAKRSATRIFALRLRGFSAISSSDAVIGLSVISRIIGSCPHPQTGSRGGQMQPRAAAAKARFTMRSSSE
jgi:hypothetical protein